MGAINHSHIIVLTCFNNINPKGPHWGNRISRTVEIYQHQPLGTSMSQQGYKVDGFKILHQLIGFPPSKVLQDWVSIHRICSGLQALSRATRSQGDGYQFDSGSHDVSSCITVKGVDIGTGWHVPSGVIADIAMGGLNEHQQLHKFLYVSTGKSSIHGHSR